MKKYFAIGILVLTLIILVGFVVLNDRPDTAVSQTEEVAVKQADQKATDECGDNCENCPEKMKGECKGHSVEAADCPEKCTGAEKCTEHGNAHEKGSKECQELKAAGKCPHKCPGHKAE